MRGFLLALALVLTAPVARATPMFMGLGQLPGGVSSGAADVSADGTVVVGSAEQSPGGARQAFRWTASGGMVGLGAQSEGSGVSADGSVVVGVAHPTNAPTEAFRWNAATGMVSLGHFSEFGNNWALDVSGDGSVVVGLSDIDLTRYEAFRWTAGTGMVGLGFLPGAIWSEASGISEDGSTIVGDSFVEDVGFEAFRWTASTGMDGLGRLPGDAESQAWAVSADGSVVVGQSFSEAVFQAFRWTASSGMVGLGNLPDGSFVSSVANDLSGDGSLIVGEGQSESGVSTAFVWDPIHGMRSLRDVLVNDYGLDLSGWTLEAASGISADGRAIAGLGTNPSGEHEAWIAFLPEPSVGLLLALGFAGLAGWHCGFVVPRTSRQRRTR